ncbi:hypothetical protein KIPB_014094, partial [Kipferlia bialata]
DLESRADAYDILWTALGATFDPFLSTADISLYQDDQEHLMSRISRPIYITLVARSPLNAITTMVDSVVVNDLTLWEYCWDDAGLMERHTIDVSLSGSDGAGTLSLVGASNQSQYTLETCEMELRYRD